MRHKFTPEQIRQGGRAAGKITFERKTGIHGASPEQRQQNSSLGGKIQGPITGAANVASGQIERIRIESEEARLAWARSEQNRSAARAMGKKYGKLNSLSEFRTAETCKLGAKIGGPRGRHVRHHLNRRLFNPLCPLCQEAKALGDIFYTAIYYPKDPRSWTT